MIAPLLHRFGMQGAFHGAPRISRPRMAKPAQADSTRRKECASESERPVSDDPAGYDLGVPVPDWTATRRGWTSAVLAIQIVRMPSLRSARTVLTSAPYGSVKVRTKVPNDLSDA